MVDILKIFSDETRLRIISLLATNPCYVSEIQEILKVNQSNVSRHLAKLLASNIVVKLKCGQHTCYKFNDILRDDYSFINQVLSDFLKEDIAKRDWDACMDFGRKNESFTKKKSMFNEKITELKGGYYA